MPAPPAPMFPLSGVRLVRFAREYRASEATRGAKAGEDLLRARSPRHFNFSGAAAKVCFAHAWYVGVARNNRRRRPGPVQPYVPPLDHSDELHRPRGFLSRAK